MHLRDLSMSQRSQRPPGFLSRRHPGAVIFRALSDPSTNEFNFLCRERGTYLRHAGFRPTDVLHQQACIRRTRFDDEARLPALQQVLIAVQSKLSLRIIPLVAHLAALF